jgi:hypothetical protein
MFKLSREDKQWAMSGFECPSCPRTMMLVGKEKSEPESSDELLTFQCECGQVFTASGDQ